MAQKKPKRIFISYRWSYAYNEAKVLQRSIEANFEGVSVFRDEERARPGGSISKTILRALDETDLVLALLHEDWQQKPPIQEGKYRNKLFLEDDWVRMELDYARNEKGLNVVPILCNAAKLPPRNDPDEINHALPECLHFLCDDLIAKKMDRSNESEEGILQFLEKELGLARRKKVEKPVPPNRLKEEGLELPDVMPDKKEVPGPFLGLPYFEEKHARLFFGRSEEICALWDLLERKPQQLLLLHGYSGVGKSSLLHAGLFPRIKRKGWNVVHERRQSEKNLKSLLKEMLPEVQPNGKTLLAIDQLEEALIDPFEGQDELPPFFEKIKTTIEEHPGLKVLLGFRKEYLPELQKQVNASGLKARTEGYFLEPLDAESILEAIVLDDDVKTYYRFEYEAGLEEKIAAGIEEQDPDLHKKEASSKAPWLQMLLLNLWKEAEKEQGSFGALKLTEAHFKKVRRQNFPSMVADQLGKLEQLPEPHCSYYRQGLTLDLLYFLTTSSNTAGIQPDAVLFERYAVSKKELLSHLRELENLQLVIRLADRDEKMHTRLAHDALAPIIRQRHEQSDKPVQRAHRIFEGKKRTVKASVDEEGNNQDKTEYNPIQDKEDIRILKQARPFMYKWLPGEQLAFDKGKEAVKKAEAELRDRTAFAFDTLAQDALQLLESVDHLEALPKFEAALGLDVPLAEKQSRLQEGIEELLCFFAHTGRHYPQAREAAQLLVPFDPGEAFRALIDKCRNEGWNRQDSFIPLLNTLTRFNLGHFKRRYLPVMIEVEGDTFDMGGKVSWQDPSPGQQANPVHQVKVNSFMFAETPFTFYQHALYCAATERSVKANTPPLGRKGDQPIVLLSWYEAVEIANWLNAFHGITPYYGIDKTRGRDEKNKTDDSNKYLVTIPEGAKGFRLPTEAEWEFAARGGVRRRSKTAKEGLLKNLEKAIGTGKTPDFDFAGSDNLDEVGWYWKNSGEKRLAGPWDYEKIQANNCQAQPVKGMKPNELGLYDMSGNVWEWCWDWFDWDYYEECKKVGVIENPIGPEGSKGGRVLRGGSWNNFEDDSRVPVRYNLIPNFRNDLNGFRLAQDL